MFRWYICGDCGVNEEEEGEVKSLKTALKKSLTELVKYENWVRDDDEEDLAYPSEVKVSFPIFSEHPKDGEVISLVEVEKMVKEEGYCQFRLIDGRQGWVSIHTKKAWDEEMEFCQISLDDRCQEEADVYGRPQSGWTGGGQTAYAVPTHKWFKSKTASVWHEVKDHNEDKTEVATICGKSYNPEKCRYQEKKPRKVCKKCAEA
jgi:hypothetical protein